MLNNGNFFSKFDRENIDGVRVIKLFISVFVKLCIDEELNKNEVLLFKLFLILYKVLCSIFLLLLDIIRLYVIFGIVFFFFWVVKWKRSFIIYIFIIYIFIVIVVIVIM